jgi:hypothetical protein
MRDLEAQFDHDMRELLVKEREVGFNSSRTRQMIEQHGGVKTAHLLLQPDRQLPPDTFGYLRRINRRDLSVEWYVVMDRYEPLFSQEEREIARWRLDYED